MIRLIVLFLLVPLVVIADDKHSITLKVQNYLNQLNTAKANFVQISDWDGSSLDGIFYLNRPGKLRFEYTSPLEDFIVADGTFIFYYDAELEQQSNTLIGQSPADILLSKKIDLIDGKVDVTDVVETEDSYELELVEKGSEGNGSLSLVFQKDPLILKEWVVLDPQGYKTKIVLNNLKTDVELDKKLFYYIDPKHGEIEYNN